MIEASHPKPKPFFTKENARQYASLGGKARWKKPEPKIQPDLLQLAQAQTESFIGRSIESVRSRIDRIFEQMARTADPDAVAKQATALAKLEAIERNLSQRPGAGTLKPRTERQARSRPIFGEDPAPAPRLIDAIIPTGTPLPADVTSVLIHELPSAITPATD